MELRSRSRFVLALLVACTLVACGKKKPPASLSTAPPPATTAPESEDSSFAQFGSESSNNSGFKSSDINRGLANDSAVPAELQRIHFDYDKSDITSDAREILNKDAAYLHAHSNLVVEVGGHCDERGSTDYNIALGERRAEAASRYLAELGISNDKLKVVSYGEDKPLSFGHTEYDFALNRRVEFKPLN
jgi:peptidoglycan-associated lipoprotein